VVRQRQSSEFQVGYRHVTRPEGEWFLAAQLSLLAGDVDAAQQKIKTLLAKRSASQPTTQPSCGSVFRNPPGDHAARLIESIGLKGRQLGGAQVSEKHANFIVNIGGATAADIETLIETVQHEVKAATGVDLITEVHRIGEPK
jgi:UDP-N-acetylmuramate dehydrogenase